MKKNLKILQIIIIIWLTTSINANKCSPSPDPALIKNDPELIVLSLDENIAKVVEENGTSHVYILETKVFGNSKTTMTLGIFINQIETIQSVFTVSIKDAKSGLVFANDFSKVNSVEQFSLEITFGLAKTKTPIIPIFVNIGPTNKQLRDLTAISPWVEAGFEGAVKNKDIGMACLTTFNDITMTEFQQMKEQFVKDIEILKTSAQKFNFQGGETSTCHIGANGTSSNDYKGWVKDALKNPNGVTSVELFFLGIDFGHATFGDLIEATPGFLKERRPKGKNGFFSEEIKAITEKFPYTTKKVVVSIVEKLPE